MRSGPTNQTAAMLLNRLACAFLAACGAAAHGQPLTLDEAQRIAEQNHPLLRSTRSEVSATEAELQESKALLWNNPQLSAEARQRRLGQVNEPDVSRRDAALGISQTFETGGQPRARRAAAQAALEAIYRHGQAADLWPPSLPFSAGALAQHFGACRAA